MSENRISRSGQIKIYTGKCFRAFKNEKQWINFLSALIITILVSIVTGSDFFNAYEATRKGCFAIICACIWMGLFNSIRSICRERDIIKREHRTGLHISSYIMAHVIYEMFLCAVEVLIILLVVFVRNIHYFPLKGVLTVGPLDMYVTLFLVTFAADMLSLCISCFVTTENAAMTVMPFVLIAQLVLANVIFELEGITQRVSNLTVSKWGVQGALSIANTSKNVYQMYIWMDEGCDPKVGVLLSKWGMLLLFAAIYIVVSILVLKRVDKDKR